MSRKLAPWLLGASVTALTALTAVPASADILIPIRPNQHFEGLVNGRTNHAIITTMNCYRNGLGLLVGHPAPGQHVSAVLDPASDGFTGSGGDAIDVYIPAPAPNVIVPVVLHEYNQPATIPVTFAVPCSGTGQVQFVPDPSSATAVTETVSVTFVPVLPPPPA